MKLNGKVLVAVAMVLGATAAIGCNRPSDAPVQPETAPVAQAAETNSSNTAATDESASVVVGVSAALPAPPALRFENAGVAPSAHHAWQRGYWRWDAPTTVYVWAPGYWEDTAVSAPYAPPAPIVEDYGYAPGVDYWYVPGFWRWSGVSYVWAYGHWSLRNDVGFYYRSAWAYDHGRWGYRAERWDHDRMDRWEHEHPDYGRHYADRHEGEHDGHGEHGEHGQHAGYGEHGQPVTGAHGQPAMGGQPAVSGAPAPSVTYTPHGGRDPGYVRPASEAPKSLADSGIRGREQAVSRPQPVTPIASGATFHRPPLGTHTTTTGPIRRGHG